MIVYGRNPVREALRGRRTVNQVWASHGAAREPWLTESGVTVHPAETEEIERRAGSDGHQGICAEVSAYRYVHESELLGATGPLIVALDEIQNPQNLGSICRTAEVAGVTGVVICERRAAEVTPAVCKASAGAVEHLPIARVRNLSDFLAAAKDAGCWCYGAAADAPGSYEAVDFTGGAVLVLGAEGRGLRPRVADSCDALLSLPVRGRIDSLNVGAAAAVLIYAATRAR